MTEAKWVSSVFTDLSDGPGPFTGKGGQLPLVNYAETALEYRSLNGVLMPPGESFANLQAIVNANGQGAVFFFLPNITYNFGGSLLAFSAREQSFVSLGQGAILDNGGIEVNKPWCGIENLLLQGTSTSGYGLHITDTSQTDNGGGNGPNYRHEYSTFLRCNNVEIRGKTWGIYNNIVSGLNRFNDLRIIGCTNGVYVNHSDVAVDSGDWQFTGGRITAPVGGQTGTGMQIVKLGGLTLHGTKFQSWDLGLLLEPDSAAATIATGRPIQGVYVSNSRFEDCGTWDIKISAGAGVASAKYVRGFKMVGGTFHRALLNKSFETTFDGVHAAPGANPPGTYGTLQIDTGATRTSIVNAPEIAAKLAGSGTDYLIIGNDDTNGAHIRAGGVLTLFDSWTGASGKTLQQLHGGT